MALKKKEIKKEEKKAKNEVTKKDETTTEEAPKDAGEAQALKLYNEAIAKGINPEDIGNQATDIVSGADKKEVKEVVDVPKEAPPAEEKK